MCFVEGKDAGTRNSHTGVTDFVPGFSCRRLQGQCCSSATATRAANAVPVDNVPLLPGGEVLHDHVGIDRQGVVLDVGVVTKGDDDTTRIERDLAACRTSKSGALAALPSPD